MESLYFTNDEAQNLLKKNSEMQFATNYGFLSAHNGFRRGSLHVLMGTAGSGKTTLIRSILRDFIFQRENKKFSAALWLSEESIEEYKTQFAKGAPSHEQLMSTFITSEIDSKDMQLDVFINRIKDLRPDFLIIDNVTTSRFYDNKRPEEQSRFVKYIKEITKEIECATLAVVHTKQGVYDNQDRLIEIDDIRGNKSLANMAEFFYIWQRFQTGDNEYYPIMRIRKHRGQDLINSFFRFMYDKETRSYKRDYQINMGDISAKFKNRMKLNGK